MDFDDLPRLPAMTVAVYARWAGFSIGDTVLCDRHGTSNNIGTIERIMVKITEGQVVEEDFHVEFADGCKAQFESHHLRHFTREHMPTLLAQ